MCWISCGIGELIKLIEQFSDYTKIFKKIEKVIKKGDYTLGNEVDKFERNIKKIMGARYAIP